MIVSKIQNLIKESIKKIVDSDDIYYLVEKCKNIQHGDFSTNVALIIAKKNKKNPMEVAQSLIKIMEFSRLFKKITVANPGFINFWLSDEYKTDLLNEIICDGSDYGKFPKKNINYSVEYVSANPTGYLHIGHARNAVMGNCILNILKWYGFGVVSEYVINDAGNQMNKLAAAVFIRYLQLFNINIQLPEDSYHGEEIILVAKILKKCYGSEFMNCTINDNGLINNAEAEFKIRWFARELFLKFIKNDLYDLGVEIQYYFSEYKIHQQKLIAPLVDILKQKNAAFEQDGAVWLNTSKYGDDKDRVLIKSDGTPTYFVPDILYHLYKFKTHNTNICLAVWGADHYSYITRMKAAVQILGIDPNNLIIVTLQMVRLLKNGKEYKMSKRSGQSLTTRDLINSIGKDAARWFLVCQSSNNHIEIDVDVATKKDSNNPLYYVQYAHARANQLLQREILNYPDKFNMLNNDIEREIINELAFFKYTIENCALTYEPYKLTVYLLNLAKLFHTYYSNMKIFNCDNPAASQQYYLIKAVKQIIQNGLTILGINAPEKM